MFSPKRSLQDYSMSPQYRRPWSPEPFDPIPKIAGPSNFNAREPSDASVQALDLADYAAHLRASQFPPHPIRYDDVVPGSIFPRSGATSSRSMPTIGRPGTHRRPFSLPPASAYHQTRQEDLEEAAIDTTHFPPWSRGWYAESHNSPQHLLPYDDLPPPSSPFLTRKYGKSPFDPAYVHQLEFDPYDEPPTVESLQDAYGHNPSIPSLPPSYTSPLHADRKADRYRMLEAEFAPKADEKLAGMDECDDDDRLRVGAVDLRGRLISSGPRRRKILRVFQVFILLATSATILYGLLFIHPTEAPPPQGKLPSYLVPFASLLCLVGYIYFLLIRPRSHNKTANSVPDYEAVPVNLSGLTGKKNKKAQKNQGGGLQLTLLLPSPAPPPMDASACNGARARPTLPELLAMEHKWSLARRTLFLLTWYDATFTVIWFIIFILILLGPRCDSTVFGGWCTAYNSATAGAALLALCCCLSTFWDIVDLFSSRRSPRTGL